MCYHANKKNIKLVLQGRIACWADRLPEFDNSKMVCNYRKLITCMYRIHVRASHYKINPPLLITWTDWTECTDRLYRLPIQTVQTKCTDCLYRLYRESVQTDCTDCLYRLYKVYRLPIQTVQTDCTDCLYRLYRQTVQTDCTDCLYRLYRQCVQTDCGSTYASLEHRWSCLPSGRFASLELSSADRHVADRQSLLVFKWQLKSGLCCLPAVTTVNITPHTVCVAIPSSDLLNFVRCPISWSTLLNILIY